MKLGEFNVFNAINTLGYGNDRWLCTFYFEETSVRKQTNFGADEKVKGFVVYVWISKDNEMDIMLFDKTCITPKYVLNDYKTGEKLLVFELN